MGSRTTFTLLTISAVAALSLGHGNPVRKSTEKEISTKVGKTFTVTIDENPTTGYQLAFLSTGNEPWRLVSKSFKKNPSKDEMVGVGGKATFTFKATKKGEGTLVFVNLQMFNAEESIKSGTVTTYRIKVK